MSIRDQLLNSLKRAMKGEMDGITLYQNAADHSNDPQIKEFFQSRAEEERAHYGYLMQYYQEITNDIEPTNLSGISGEQTAFSPIISDDFVRRIGSDQILFSAISTAILLEKDAIDHYTRCAQETDLTTLKAFYGALADWEKTHYDDLLSIQKEAEVYWWNLNQFEPF
ncbi:MAG: ferritin family protein [Candidatus Cloacimonetes bacterium]|nr:ferritin family protein [Candidatus Cloacimonadota bacterium]